MASGLSYGRPAEAHPKFRTREDPHTTWDGGITGEDSRNEGTDGQTEWTRRHSELFVSL